MTFTYNPNGVCLDTDHNPNGSQPANRIDECKECKHRNVDNNPDVSQSLTLSFGLPGLNEMINVARGNRYASANQKKKFTKKVEKELIAQQCIPKEPLTSISINCSWTEGGHARDPDNIRVGIKYILDAMVNTGVLKDDSLKHVKFIGDTFQMGEKRMVEVNWIA